MCSSDLAAADEKFNKAMKLAESNGDSAAAVKEALDAYAALPKLDGDARFHVAVLQSAAGDYPDATKSCELLLKEHPNHLLAIGAAARASKKAGDTAAAKTWYQRYVDAWGAPREDLPEYKEHNRLLTIYQKEAVAFLAEAG
mgnify:CR=1 FL=1